MSSGISVTIRFFSESWTSKSLHEKNTALDGALFNGDLSSLRRLCLNKVFAHLRSYSTSNSQVSKLKGHVIHVESRVSVWDNIYGESGDCKFLPLKRSVN